MTAADRFRAAASTRILAMLAEPDESAIARAMRNRSVERKTVRELRVPLLVALSVLVAGIVFGHALRIGQQKCTADEHGEEEEGDDDDASDSQPDADDDDGAA